MAIQSGNGGDSTSHITSTASIIHTLGKPVTDLCLPLPSVSPAQSLSAGESSGSQPLEPHWIAAASADPQSPSCWTAPVHSDIVNIPMVTVSSCLT